MASGEGRGATRIDIELCSCALSNAVLHREDAIDSLRSLLATRPSPPLAPRSISLHRHIQLIRVTGVGRDDVLFHFN